MPGLITHFSTVNPQFLIRGFVLLRLDKGTDTAADASGLPGENRVEFPFRHGEKQCVVFSGGFFCEAGGFPCFL